LIDELKHFGLGNMIQTHATTLQLIGKGVMLCGPSASGKSDLGIRLIENGALLVADDRTDLTLDNKKVLASAPKEISGQMEIRGIGIITLDVIVKTHLSMVVELVNADAVQRYPTKKYIDFLGVTFPLIHLYPFEASAPAKIHRALIHHSHI
jgi:serine kinase of HPr protein (carbohydrate metabolism regulator)